MISLAVFSNIEPVSAGIAASNAQCWKGDGNAGEVRPACEGLIVDETEAKRSPGRAAAKKASPRKGRSNLATKVN